MIKSKNNIAWLYGREMLRINMPCLDTYGWSHMLKETLKPANYLRFSKLPIEEQKRVLRKITCQHGGACSTKSTDEWYTAFRAEQYSGKVFYGGLDLCYNINELLNNKNVTRLIVVEEQQDVIDIVAPLINYDDRLRIYRGNPMKFFPESKYDHMIWTEFQYWLHDDGEVGVRQNYIKSLHQNDQNKQH